MAKKKDRTLIIIILLGLGILFASSSVQASNNCNPDQFTCSQDPLGYYPDSANYSLSAASASACFDCLTAPQTFIQNAVNYIINLYNPQVGLVAVGTQSVCNNGCGGVAFNYMNGKGSCPIVPSSQRFIPFESWKDAAALAGMGLYPEVSENIFDSVQSLEVSLNWRPPQNLESVLGYIVPYTIQNTNVCFTPNYGPPTFVNFNGFQAQIDQAIPWDYGCQCYKSPNLDYSRGLGLQDPENTLAQALNYQLRGDHSDAKANLQDVANICHVFPDGSVGFGTSSPYRGILLGTFLEAEQVIGTPNLRIGCSIQEIVNTLVNIQQSDGGIANNYSCAINSSCQISSSIDEATNMGLIAFSKGVIQHIRNIAASSMYNLNSIPDTNPIIRI